jgi:hypothetical protein
VQEHRSWEQLYRTAMEWSGQAYRTAREWSGQVYWTAVEWSGKVYRTVMEWSGQACRTATEWSGREYHFDPGEESEWAKASGKGRVCLNADQSANRDEMRIRKRLCN